MTLSAETRRALFIPPLCAAGYQALTDGAEILIWRARPYTPSAERGLRLDDPVIGVDWPMVPTTVSDKDKQWALLRLAGRDNSLEGDDRPVDPEPRKVPSDLFLVGGVEHDDEVRMQIAEPVGGNDLVPRARHVHAVLRGVDVDGARDLVAELESGEEADSLRAGSPDDGRLAPVANAREQAAPVGTRLLDPGGEPLRVGERRRRRPPRAPGGASPTLGLGSGIAVNRTYWSSNPSSSAVGEKPAALKARAIEPGVK